MLLRITLLKRNCSRCIAPLPRTQKLISRTRDIVKHNKTRTYVRCRRTEKQTGVRSVFKQKFMNNVLRIYFTLCRIIYFKRRVVYQRLYYNSFLIFARGFQNPWLHLEQRPVDNERDSQLNSCVQKTWQKCYCVLLFQSRIYQIST